MIRNILLCGVGGQGILLSAKIIASAAIQAGFEVSTNEVHGMAQRGGSVTAQLRYGGKVASPLIPPGMTDVLASLETAEALRWAHWLRPGGLAVVSDCRMIPVTVSTGAAKYPADAPERLKKVFPRLVFADFDSEAVKLGDRRVSNTVMLGALSAEFPEISAEIWESAVRKCVKPEFAGINITAFNIGREKLK